jgi:enoyl-[acyl-carrier-protein] reductase (NADH)
VARAYAQRSTDAPVWITYNSDEAAAVRLRDEIGRGEIARCDVRDPASLDALAERIDAAGQRVSAVVHATVAAVRAPLLGEADQLLTALDVSAVSLLRAVTALDHLLADGAGIVFLSSKGATRVVPKYGMVGVAKAAAESIVRYLALELGGRGIRVNAVAFGAMPTKAFGVMTGRPETAEKVVAASASNSLVQPAPDAQTVADAVVALCSEAGRGITGQVIDVDGGLTLRL